MFWIQKGYCLARIKVGCQFAPRCRWQCTSNSSLHKGSNAVGSPVFPVRREAVYGSKRACGRFVEVFQCCIVSNRLCAQKQARQLTQQLRWQTSLIAPAKYLSEKTQDADQPI